MYGVYDIQKPVISASAFEQAVDLGRPPLLSTCDWHVSIYVTLLKDGENFRNNNKKMLGRQKYVIKNNTSF